MVRVIRTGSKVTQIIIKTISGAILDLWLKFGMISLEGHNTATYTMYFLVEILLSQELDL